MIRQFPHCDARILHAPGECEYCDLHPEWQELRTFWGIAFTGHAPETPTDAPWLAQLPCPADFNRPAGSSSDHQRWPGNVATEVAEDLAAIKADWVARYGTPTTRGLYVDFEVELEEVPVEPATAGPPPARKASWLRLRRR